MEIGVCGYGYTGSSALVSLIREYSNVIYLDGGPDFEFTLSYASDGLEDLEFNLVENPSKGTRCDIAIYRFMLLIDELERSYNRFTDNTFRSLAEDYLSDLIQVKWKAIRVFEYSRNPSKRIEKLIRTKLYATLKKRGYDIRCFPLKDRYLSIYPDDFLQKTQNFIKRILEFDSKYDAILLEQPFSCGDPLRSMRFYNDPICFLVDRDPRDLYVLCKRIFGTSALFIPTDKVEHFIEYYKRVRDDRKWKGSNKVVRIQFEDLIYNYEDSIKHIEKILEGIGNHTEKQRYFKPEFSKANTNIFSKFKEDYSDILIIEKELSDWLYKFPSDTEVEKEVDLNSYTFL